MGRSMNPGRRARLFEALIIGQRGRCRYCRCAMMDGITAPTFDHYDPYLVTKRNAETNLVLACWRCNKNKRCIPGDLFVWAIENGRTSEIIRVGKEIEREVSRLFGTRGGNYVRLSFAQIVVKHVAVWNIQAPEAVLPAKVTP